MLKTKIVYKKLADLKRYKNNPRKNEEAVQVVKDSIASFGFKVPLVITEDNVIVCGDTRYQASELLGLEEIPCIIADDLSEDQINAFRLVDNKTSEFAEWDFDLLEEELKSIQEIDMSQFDFDMDFLEDDLEEEKEEKKKLTDEFLIPPLSVFDTKQGYWQDRKRAWKALGINSEIGREEALLGDGLLKLAQKQGSNLTGTSIFDPVLCEIIYKWFNVYEGSVYDCFAGGSVRGIVAEKLGYKYTGIDLRKEQVEANILNASEMNLNPTWICDDSLNADRYIEDNSVDLIFSCPPYADLEVYSDDERDISNMEYEDFQKAYRGIIDIACRKLKEDRFAVFVVGDVRDKKGYYRNFIDFTKECFNDNGLQTYNEIILLEQLGTVPLRARRAFAKRKTVKVHQNVLVFFKGNCDNIPMFYSNIEVGDIEKALD